MKINLFNHVQMKQSNVKNNSEIAVEKKIENNNQEPKAKVSLNNLVAMYAPNITFGKNLNTGTLNAEDVEIVSLMEKHISKKNYDEDDEMGR